MKTISQLRPCAIVLTGATGWLGNAIYQALSSTGNPIITAGRTQPTLSKWHIPLDLYRGRLSLDDISPLRNVANSWVMIHCAGHAHRPNESATDRETFHRINSVGTKNLIECCAKARFNGFVFISSIAVYDWKKASVTPFNENGPLGPDSYYGESKLLAEIAIRNCDLQHRIIRLATVFGPGDRANFLRLATAIKHRRFILPGNGDAKKSVISLSSAASTIIKLSLAETFDNSVINLAFTEAPTLSEICHAISRDCNYPRPPSSPLAPLLCAAKIGDCISKVWKNFPITSRALTKLTRSTHVDSTLASIQLPELREINFSSEFTTTSNYYGNA